ncbi:MAG: TIGR02444 family protein [Desulfobacula sp.]|nr:TIGR02444 family protein [Desulfobacula sp.]
MEFPDHPFWNFSITVYQKQGVHEACFGLQTCYKLNINLLFLCCWVGAVGGGRLDPEQIKTANQAVDGWQQEIVHPIWKARWKLRPSYKTFPKEKTEILRKSLIQAELDAEHLEQLHLADTIVFTQNPDLSNDVKTSHVVANIFLYLDMVARQRKIQLKGPDMAAPLLSLVSACFEQGDKDKIATLITGQFSR